jgi:hypothetical protein
MLGTKKIKNKVQDIKDSAINTAANVSMNILDKVGDELQKKSQDKKNKDSEADSVRNRLLSRTWGALEKINGVTELKDDMREMVTAIVEQVVDLNTNLKPLTEMVDGLSPKGRENFTHTFNYLFENRSKEELEKMADNTADLLLTLPKDRVENVMKNTEHLMSGLANLLPSRILENVVEFVVMLKERVAKGLGHVFGDKKDTKDASQRESSDVISDTNQGAQLSFNFDVDVNKGLMEGGKAQPMTKPGELSF